MTFAAVLGLATGSLVRAFVPHCNERRKTYPNHRLIRVVPCVRESNYQENWQKKQRIRSTTFQIVVEPQLGKKKKESFLGNLLRDNKGSRTEVGK